MNDNVYWMDNPSDIVRHLQADPNFEPTAPEDLNAPAWHDGRAWADSDWVYFPASSNVYAARYCRDGSYRMQVMYGSKIKHSKKRGFFYDPPRFWEYGPDQRLDWDFFQYFLATSSKGGFSWLNLDPRWGSSILGHQIV